MTTKTSKHIAEIANAIALQAEAIAAGTTTGPPAVTAKLLRDNADTLLAWLVTEQRERVSAAIHHNPKI